MPLAQCASLGQSVAVWRILWQFEAICASLGQSVAVWRILWQFEAICAGLGTICDSLRQYMKV